MIEVGRGGGARGRREREDDVADLVHHDVGGVDLAVGLARGVEALQDLTAERLGIEGAAIKVLERSHHSAAGWLALARVFGGPLTEGLELMSADGQTVRAGTLFGVQGRITTKLGRAEPGDIVAIAKAEAMETGQIFGTAGAAPTAAAAIT